MLGRKKERGDGEGRKKYACPISLFVWQTPYAGKRSPWLVRIRESRLMPVNQMSAYIVYCVFVCMQLRERSILNSEMADVRAIFNSAVETSLLELERLRISLVLRNEKVKAISTLASGQVLLSVLKRYPTFTSCQNAACSNTFFFSGG